MRITRARYVTVCQQFLVTAVVLVVGLSAAGVMTLQIVAPEGRDAQASGMAPAIKVSEAYVDTTPVTPKVREVKVEGIDAGAARTIPGVVTGAEAPAGKKRTPTAPTRLAALSAPAGPRVRHRRRHLEAGHEAGRGPDLGAGPHAEGRCLVGLDHRGLPRRARPGPRQHRGPSGAPGHGRRRRR